MLEPLENAALETLRRVFETSAFMSVWPWDGEESRPLPDVAAAMRFRGELEGGIVLQVDHRILEPLVLNMLGDCETEKSGDERGLDALKEVLNMVCGNVLTEWLGDTPTFELSPPEVADLNSLAQISEEIALKLRFVLEDTSAELLIFGVAAEGSSAADNNCGMES